MQATLSAGALVTILIAAAASAPAQNVTGSGTANKIPKWTGTTTIGNSVMTESSGRIGPS